MSLGDVIELAVGDQQAAGYLLALPLRRAHISTKAGASKIAHHKPKKNNACVGGARGQTCRKHRLQGLGEGTRREHHWSLCGLTEAFVDHVARSERKLIVTLTSGMGLIADNTLAARLLIAVRRRL